MKKIISKIEKAENVFNDYITYLSPKTEMVKMFICKYSTEATLVLIKDIIQPALHYLSWEQFADRLT